MAKDISKTLIVGLGGTGEKVILDIKKRLLRRYGEIPMLVKFLQFDTDDLAPVKESFSYYYNGQLNNDYRYQILGPEHFKINRPGLDVVRDDRICTEKLNLSELARTYNMLLDAGANGYRVVGRAHFLNKSGQVIEKLQNTISDLKQAQLLGLEQARGYHLVNSGDVTVYVIASLAGGTGSSAFLDISRMLQLAGINVDADVNQTRDRIFGMFFLPHFFEGIPDTHNIRINAYTALSELDHCLSLADANRYPDGSPEFDDDRNDYHNWENHNKRVIYTAVYLIDAVGQHMHKLEDAASHVASFIAGSIAADANALRSGYSNSQHKMHSVKDKFQNYSSIGYCELRFNRQELVRFLLNKKLMDVLEKYKRGDSMESMLDVANGFIKNHKLYEGVMENIDSEDDRSEWNELTDAIIDMTDRRLTGISMMAVGTGVDAHTNIENSKTRYLTEIGTVATEMITQFSAQKNVIITALVDMLAQRQSGKGFVSFPDLAKQLKSLLSDMKDGLEDEIHQHETEFDKIEKDLLRTKSSIQKNSSKGFLGIGDKTDDQQRFLTSYRNKVLFSSGSATNPTLAWLKVQTARKREAIALYEALMGIVDRYYLSRTVETINGTEEILSGSFVGIGKLYDSLNSMLTREISKYNPSTAPDKETIYADAYFKDYFGEHEPETTGLTEQNQTALDNYFSSFFASSQDTNESKLAEMRLELLNLLPSNGILREIQEDRMSIDQLFEHCYGRYRDIDNPGNPEAYPQLKMLNNLKTLFNPLWQYHNFTGSPGSMEPSKSLIVGVFDTNENIFDDTRGYTDALPGWRLRTIGLGDPDRIVFLLTETGVPAFKLTGADAWANEFNQKKDNVYTFSDQRLEFIDMISPNQIGEENEIAWAYGWLFDLIHVDKGRIWVKPTMDYRLAKHFDHTKGYVDYFFKKHHVEGIDLDKCHKYFIRDMELSNDIYKQAMALLQKEKPYNAVRIKHWVNDDDITSSRTKKLSPQEKKLMDIEISNLAKRFTILRDYGIRLDADGKIYLSGNEDDIRAAEARFEEEKKKKSNADANKTEVTNNETSKS